MRIMKQITTLMANIHENITIKHQIACKLNGSPKNRLIRIFLPHSKDNHFFNFEKNVRAKTIFLQTYFPGRVTSVIHRNFTGGSRRRGS